MSMDLLKPQRTWAKHPFDDASAVCADLNHIILQSSDDVYFRVSKFILTLASPVFADIFSLPSFQDPSEIQIVPLPGDSKTLDLCLRHLYPVHTPDAVPLRDAGALAEFARKYQIDVVNKIITRYLADHVEHDPIDLYYIAATYQQGDIGAKAARACLNVPFSRLLSHHVPGAMAGPQSELLRYHLACGEAASAVASKREWFSSLQNRKLVSVGYSNCCAACVAQDYIGVQDETSTSNFTAFDAISAWAQAVQAEKRCGPLSLWNYLYRSALVLAHHPTPKAVAAEDFVLKGHDCPSCPSDMRQQMLEFSGDFQREIKKAVERVPLPHAVAEFITI